MPRRQAIDGTADRVAVVVRARSTSEPASQHTSVARGSICQMLALRSSMPVMETRRRMSHEGRRCKSSYKHYDSVSARTITSLSYIASYLHSTTIHVRAALIAAFTPSLIRLTSPPLRCNTSQRQDFTACLHPPPLTTNSLNTIPSHSILAFLSPPHSQRHLTASESPHTPPSPPPSPCP
jgi:hypothetical protein